MWTPWRLALIAGTAAGAATALAQLSLDVISLTTAAVVAVLVCLLTRLGLWASKRPSLPVIPALGVAVANTVIASLSALPIETHAELMDVPASQEHGALPMGSAYLVGLAALVAPALITFIIGRVYGVPPNTSLERTREG